jgi:hypothetical protein
MPWLLMDLFNVTSHTEHFNCFIREKHLNKDDLQTYQSILHEENLAARFGEDLKFVLKNVSVIKFIRSGELNIFLKSLTLNIKTLNT